MMFNEFLEFFGSNRQINITGSSYDTFLDNFEGQSFGEGLFRAFDKKKIAYWENTVSTAYPHFKNQFNLFGYDWLGRCFAIDLRNNTKGNILMFEIGTKDVLEIPCDFLNFLNQEIPQYTDACLALNFYREWLMVSKKFISNYRCVGYKVPLFLGGEDSIDKIEDIDMDVYWHILSKL